MEINTCIGENKKSFSFKAKTMIEALNELRELERLIYYVFEVNISQLEITGDITVK